MSMIDPSAAVEITAFEWVPPFAVGLVRDLRPRWACEETGIPYRERLISALERPRWYFSEQPWGQVPTLKDGDIHVFESGATLLHLAEKTGELLPSEGQGRADVLSWLFAAFNSVEPQIFDYTNVTVFSAREEWAQLRKPSLEEALAKRLEPVERHVADRDWLAGNFSIADIAMITVLRALRGTGVTDRYPALTAYVTRGEQRPAFQRALADQLAAFERNTPPNESTPE